ncbi:MAG: 5'-deoxynucleotidase [Lachnospiraceae bacterium]|jgi:5'-deoxynucleotidase|nr:5'-deoxynucleotidase [Lachnospiraceae bacterium]
MQPDENREYAFFAMVSRLRWISRWALMRNSSGENLSEHSLQVAMLAHALSTIGNERLGKHLDSDRAAVIAMYHDVSEILTGDMPTPVKYRNDTIREAYREIEADADRRLLSLLPEDLRAEYSKVLEPGDEFSYEKKLVKGADKLSAYIKCIEEKKAGNNEFRSAEKAALKAVRDMHLPEIDIFTAEFLPAYSRTLDEIRPEQAPEE